MPTRCSYLLPLLLCSLAGCFHEVELGSGEKMTPVEQEAASGDWPRWRGPRSDGTGAPIRGAIFDNRWANRWLPPNPPIQYKTG